MDVIKSYHHIDHSKTLESGITEDEAEKDYVYKESPEFHPPIGFKRVFEDDYLNQRGFKDWQFENYVIGRTRIDQRLKGYIIFLITENGVCKGSVARSTKSKEWITAYNEKVKKI